MRVPANRPLALAAASVLLTAHGAFALQEPVVAAAADLPSARSVIERHLEVTNGRYTVEHTQNYRVRGKVAAMGVEGSYEIVSAKPNVQVTTMEFGEMGTIKQGFDGEHAWQVHPMIGARLMEGVEAMQIASQAAYGNGLRDPAGYETIETLGKEAFDGDECYKLKLVAKAAEGMDAEKTRKARTSIEFYAIDSGLLVGSLVTQASPMGEVEVKQVFADYAKFGEELVPTRIVIAMSMGEYVRTVESVEFDGVPPDAFALPPEIAKLTTPH